MKHHTFLPFLKAFLGVPILFQKRKDRESQGVRTKQNIRFFPFWKNNAPVSFLTRGQQYDACNKNHPFLPFSEIKEPLQSSTIFPLNKALQKKDRTPLSQP